MAEVLRTISGLETIMTLPEGHAILELDSSTESVWCKAARPDGDPYWIDLGTVIKADGSFNG